MNVQANGPSTLAVIHARPLRPGYLFTPFGWAAVPVAAMIQSEPRLLPHVFELDRQRMHVIALALAHIDGDPAPALAPVLFRASVRDVLRRVLGQSPHGIKRLIRRLPSSVLSPQGYRRLIELLDNSQCGKLLHHLDQVEITNSIVRVLYDLPVELRPVLTGVMQFIEPIETLEHLPQALRWLAERGAAASWDDLIADLAGQTQPAQLVARLTKLVAELPLPHTLPPARIGKARRIDRAVDICALAKAFKNCLAGYTRQIDAGACAIYLWQDAIAPAACLVTRQGRLGWCLSEALGPGNAKLGATQLQQITAAFADATIPHQLAICALECILHADCTTRPRPRRLRQQDFEEELREMEAAEWDEELLDGFD